MTATACTNKGCGKSFLEDENRETACQHHPGAPVFHEGLKGWSCCSKKVTDFDEFLKIPGCAMGKHSSAPQPSSNATTPAAITSSTAPLPTTTTKDGVEVYGTPTTTSSNTSAVNPVTAVAAATPVKVKEEDLHDAEDAVIAIGSKCKRPSCKAIYSSSSSSSAEECVFHSGEPVFHEGSKGWSCCSRKVLEFDEFLKIEGCKRAKHRFTDPKLPGEEEEFVECRHDWYQTQTSVIISVFAKKLDKQKVNVVFEENELKVDMVFQDGKKSKFYSTLCQPIASSECKFTVLTTKLEIVLKKANGISWPSLEPCANITSWTTFGAVGSVGTVGGKQAVIATDSPVHLMKK